VLKSKRPVVVMGPAYYELSNACYEARRRTDEKQFADSRAKLLSTIFKDPIKPGVRRAVSGAAKLNFGSYPGAGKLAANVTWLADKDFLRVKADVTDRFFAPAALDGAPEDGSSVQLFICPSGIGYDINAITLVPAGAGGKARVTVACGQYGPSSADREDCAKRAKSVSATWNRTGRGYTLDAKIPWSIVRGYYAGWKLLPIDAAISTWTPNGRSQLIMNTLGDPMKEPFVYSALKVSR